MPLSIEHKTVAVSAVVIWKYLTLFCMEVMCMLPVNADERLIQLRGLTAQIIHSALTRLPAAKVWDLFASPTLSKNPH